MNAIETMNNEELDSLKVEIKAREHAIKLESAQEIIKQIYAGCTIKFMIKDTEQIAKVGYINLKGVSAITSDGAKKFVEFERVLEVLDSIPSEIPVLEAKPESPSLFGKKTKK